MPQYVTRIRTDKGDLPYDYNSLANLPDLNPAHMGAVPNTTTINEKPLTGDIVLTPEDIGLVIDDTLSISGACADAKAVGDALAGKASIEDLNGKSPIDHTHTVEDIGAAPLDHTHTLEELGAASVEQLEAKANAEHGHDASDIISGTLEADRLPVISMAKGGTEATDGATGLQNLFAAGPTILSAHQYGNELPEPGIVGRLFLKKVSV